MIFPNVSPMDYDLITNKCLYIEYITYNTKCYV